MIIPAHNEQAVIGRCLEALVRGAHEGELEIVVVCNGCTDATAQVARDAAPLATVIEIPEASKISALNAGERAAHYFPRFYVDADVELPISSLRATAEVLRQPGVYCAAPRPYFELTGRPWAVKAFYEVWQNIPYITEQMVGSGVYALSREGRQRFGEFPQLTNDDQFVALQFAPAERRSLPDATFVVHPPFALKGLVNMRSRAYRGNRELSASGLVRTDAPENGAKSALALAADPHKTAKVAGYFAVNVLGHLQARRPPRARWERDDSARVARAPASSAPPHVCYVTSKYPALSHTFVMREIAGLRSCGVTVSTVSVHRAGPNDVLSVADEAEAARTWTIFPLDKVAFAKAHLRALTRSPRAYWSTLFSALRWAPPGPRAALWQLFYFAEAVYALDHARRQGARHLHAHLANVGADICWLGAHFARLAYPAQEWSWSFTMHGPTELYDVSRYNLTRKVESASAVICISDFARSQLMYLTSQEHWGKLAIAHMGVDLERYPFTPVRQGGGLRVLCVARLVPAKGLEVLLEALGTLQAGGTELSAVIAGDGPLRAELEESARRHGLGGAVTFAGPVGQDDMARLYQECDVFCLPSFAEGVPVVLMEAMASGRPVVTTRVAGTAELVEDGVSGNLVAPGNVGELVAALQALAADCELRASMGTAGRRKVEKDFDAAACARDVAGIFRRLAPGTGSGEANPLIR